MVGRHAANHAVEAVWREGKRFSRPGLKDQVGKPSHPCSATSFPQHSRRNVQAGHRRHEGRERHRRETGASGYIQPPVRRPAVRVFDEPRERFAVPRIPLRVVLGRLAIELFLRSS